MLRRVAGSCISVPRKKPAAARHSDQHFLEVVGATWRQPLDLQPLDLQRLAPPRIGSADHFIDKAAVAIEIGKLGVASQQQSLLKASLR